jgi:hypothetical protein
MEVWLHAFLTTAPDGGEFSALLSGFFSPYERAPGIHGLGRWVDPSARLNAVIRRKISCTYWESNPNSSLVLPVG